MRFAICNETFSDWPLERAFDFARQSGYTGIEIAPFTLVQTYAISGPGGLDAHAIDIGQRERVRRVAEAAELEVIGLHWLLAKTAGYHLTSPDAKTRKRTAEYLVELAQLCRDVGGTIMVFGSPQQRNLAPGISRHQGMDHAAEVFRTAIGRIEDLGVTLAIEPLGPAEGNFLLTAADAVELIDRIGSPNCRLHLDCKAMSSESTPIPDLIRNFAKYLVHFHANDPNRQGPGFGELDFAPIFAALEEVEYRGWISVEVFDYDPGIERLTTESIDYMRRIAAEIRAA